VQGAQHESPLLEQPAVMEHFALMAWHDLVATVEATSDQLGVVARLADDCRTSGSRSITSAGRRT